MFIIHNRNFYFVTRQPSKIVTTSSKPSDHSINKAERQQLIKELKAKMLAAAKSLDFEEAARLRDQIAKIKKL